jgi:hypothetical protein
MGTNLALFWMVNLSRLLSIAPRTCSVVSPLNDKWFLVLRDSQMGNLEA